MIEVSHLTKKFGSNVALDDVSFKVEKGEIVGFLGPNGAGKSTTMNIITGCLSSTSGDVFVGGISVLDSPSETKKLVGFLPEQPPLYPDMTVEEYLSFVFELKKCTLNKKEHLAEISDITKITDVSRRLIKNLSKGYRQRLGVASALIGNPPVIILDEPTVGLDPKQVIEIRNLIRNLGKTHTVILSSHVLSEVQSVCDRILIINEGRIIADETSEVLLSSLKMSRRFRVKICGPQKEVLALLKSVGGILSAEATGEREGDAFTFRIEVREDLEARKNLFRALAGKDWPLVSIEPVSANLEDVFIRVTDQDNKKRAKESARGEGDK